MSNGKAGEGCLAGIGCVVVLGVVGMILPKSEDSPAAPANRRGSARLTASKGGQETGAWSAARMYVEARLKNPGSADFPWYDRSAIHFIGNGKYRINSYVDATNSFGGTIRTNYSCVVRMESGEWALESISMQ